MTTITIDIDDSGNAQVEAAGVNGASCKDLTRAVEAAIGHVTADQKKPEFYQPQSQTQPAQQTGGQG